MKTCPLVSVVIPAYNQARFITSALESILAQSYSPIEVIVVNDGSTDDTAKILKQYTGIQVIEQENKGLSAARNAGILASKGDLIALLDSDDVMVQERIQFQVAYLQDNPDIDVVYTALTVIDENGKVLNTIRRESLPPDQFLAFEFFRNQVPSPSSILAKSEVFQKEPFDATFRIGEDLEWIIRTAHQFTFGYLDKPLTHYRRHQSNLSEKLENLRAIELQILNHYGTKHIIEVIKSSSIRDKELLIGKILYIMENYNEALPYLSISTDPLALFYCGNCYYEMEQYEKAMDFYRESLKRDSSNPACHNNYAMCCLNLGDSHIADEEFRRAIALKTGYLDPQYKKFTRRELREDLLPYKY